MNYGETMREMEAGILAKYPPVKDHVPFWKVWGASRSESAFTRQAGTESFTKSCIVVTVDGKDYWLRWGRLDPDKDGQSLGWKGRLVFAAIGCLTWGALILTVIK